MTRRDGDPFHDVGDGNPKRKVGLPVYQGRKWGWLSIGEHLLEHSEAGDRVYSPAGCRWKALVLLGAPGPQLAAVESDAGGGGGGSEDAGVRPPQGGSSGT